MPEHSKWEMNPACSNWRCTVTRQPAIPDSTPEERVQLRTVTQNSAVVVVNDRSLPTIVLLDLQIQLDPDVQTRDRRGIHGRWRVGLPVLQHVAVDSSARRTRRS